MANIRIEITRNFVEVRELGESFLIGRGEDADLILLHQSVSRRHARIFHQDSAYHVEDLGSSNGVLVNAERIITRKLESADVVQVGVHRLFYSEEEIGEANVKIDFTGPLTEEGTTDLQQKLLEASDLVVRFLSDEQSVETVQAAVLSRFDQLGLDDLQRINMETALNEAVGNAVRHGHKYDASKVVTLRMILEDTGRLILQVTDEGPGFDYRAALKKGMELDAVDAARMRFQEGGMGGLGILMMLRCVDNVEYNEAGNVLTLSKYLTDQARQTHQPPPVEGLDDTQIVGDTGEDQATP